MGKLIIPYVEVMLCGADSRKLQGKGSSGVTTADRNKTSHEVAMFMQDKAGFLKDRLPKPGFGVPSSL